MSINTSSTSQQKPPAMAAELHGIRMNDLRTIRIIRLAVAVTIAMTIAQLVNWPLSFVAPVLTVAFLDMPIPAPTMRRFAAYLSYAVLSVVLVFIFIMLSNPIHWFLFPLMAWQSFLVPIACIRARRWS